MANLEHNAWLRASGDATLALSASSASALAAEAIPNLRAQLLRESHERSRAMGLTPIQHSDYSPQRLADFSITRERSARLYAQAMPVMDMLLEQVKHTASMVVLTDDTGCVLRTSCHSTFMEQASRVALREGVSWAEASKGTNAIGTALMLESEVVVHANEHYIQSNHVLTCSAAPIFDPSGSIIGVLDVTGDRRSFHPHTLGLVKMSARMIENHWFRDAFRSKLCIRFHRQAEMIGTVVEGILALDADGRVQGINPEGLAMLHTSGGALRMQGVQGVFGETFGQLLGRLRAARSGCVSVQLTGGETLYARADFGDSGLDQVLDVSSNSTSNRAAKPSTKPERINKPAYSGPTLAHLGRDDALMRSLVEKVRQVIDKDVPILILGETGTGKELLARAIHQASQRRDEAFVAVNCASIPEALIESELFGYEEGAFTGARRKGATGKLLQANGGTLLLDEIGDMPPSLQARLLRVLQERQVTPLGSGRSITFDVNVICATHRNLRDMLTRQQFREDLYYRINGLSVQLPRLAQRNDLRHLCTSILQEVSPQRHMTVADEVLQAFEGYAWPGNVRQLHGVLRTAAIMAGSQSVVTCRHLPEDLLDDLGLNNATCIAQAALPPSSAPTDSNLDSQAIDPLQQVKLDSIRHALAVCDGNVSLAAKRLNVSRNTIYRKLRALGLKADEV